MKERKTLLTTSKNLLFFFVYHKYAPNNKNHTKNVLQGVCHNERRILMYEQM